MDPYQILGVSSSASDDEVKKAYRAQCKKYHPDLNPDNPAAEEKFKQVQTAYDQVMKMRQGGGSYAQQANPYGQSQQGYADPFGFSGSGFRFYGPFGFGFDFGDSGFEQGYQQSYRQSAASDEPIEMQAARNYINNRRYREALNVLNSVQNRTAQWYYYHALANMGIGNSINALEDARKAVSLEPNNPTYQQLLNRLQGQGQQYRAQTSNYAAPTFSMGRFCFTMMLCNLCCGRGIYPFFCC